MLDYCVAWALGQCGTAASIEPLRKLEAKHPAESVRRIAGVALFQLLEGDKRNSAIAESVAQLPESLRRLAVEGPADAFTNELNRVLAQDEAGSNACLEIIYLIDNEHIRPALLDFLQNAPLEPGKFHRVRHIFKAAELKRDPEVFGILSRRFEVTPSRYKSYGPDNYQYQPAAGPNPTQAFSQQTRKFLRRRVWRTLSRLAELGEASDYARMAAGVLKSFSDADGLPARQEQLYEWNPQTRRGHYETTGVSIRGRCGVRSVKRRLWLLLLVRGSQIGDSGGPAGQMRWIRKYWRQMDGSSYRASLRDEFPTDSRAGSRQDCREFFHRLPRTLRNTSSTTFAD
ncbi:MAG: hypothetical protein ACI8P0_000559 [Planctomycetaceae bacterium]|jgi:hypothetical protein